MFKRNTICHKPLGFTPKILKIAQKITFKILKVF